MMTSATQSNSGASAYMGYLYAFAGDPDSFVREEAEDVLSGAATAGATT